MANPYESLTQANADYHKAVNKVFRDNDFITDDLELRAEVKAKFGAITNAVFNMMKQANAIIAQYYEVT